MALPTSFAPGSSSIPASTVELSVSCRDLMDKDVFSKSDPLCVLFVRQFATTDHWIEYGRTEIIDNNLNPDFVKKFTMNYFFEERQFLKFSVYDVDCKSPDLRQHDYLGSIECTLGEIVSTGKLTRKLSGSGVTRGSIITVWAEELVECKKELTFQFQGRKLDRKDFFSGSSDPFLAFYRVNEDGSYTVVHRTEVIKNSRNPTWRPFSIPMRTLCGADPTRSILIRCFDWNRSGREDLIGECVSNVQYLSRGPGQETMFTLINPKFKVKKKNYQGSGTLSLLLFQEKQLFTFFDFIAAGTQLNCTIAIDFTASNGNPTMPNSLHYINPYQPNQYARALQAVGEIIQDYDSDKLFPVLGFGARLPPDNMVSHEFFVNGHPTNPYCDGLQGVLQAYHKCLMAVQLYGPTNFAPCINHVARFASAKRDGSEYFILLILTDGIITDMPQTKEAIVMASTLPLSIIIVGVGNADFDAMNELDGDQVRLTTDRGQQAARDIVQFVPFRDFVAKGSLDVAQAYLAKEVLAEIPDQFVSYMRANNIHPGAWPNARPANSPTVVQPAASMSPARAPIASAPPAATGHRW